MSISKQIREAALGPAPRSSCARYLFYWLDGRPDACAAAYDLLGKTGVFNDSLEVTQRTFLLLVAEAVK